MDTAPARSAELLAGDRVDAALVPVIAYQMIDGVRLVPDVCVGARERVRSVCLVTKGADLADVHSVSLDVSSRTSVALTKIIFREFLGFEPIWTDAQPDIDAMLDVSDAALIIGDPALRLSVAGDSAIRTPHSVFKVFDLADLWHKYTGLGFVFAMWMTRRSSLAIDLAAARDEGIVHVDDIAANYASDTGVGRDAMKIYLTENVSFSIDRSMREGLALFFELANKSGLNAKNKPLEFIVK